MEVEFTKKKKEKEKRKKKKRTLFRCILLVALHIFVALMRHVYAS